MPSSFTHVIAGLIDVCFVLHQHLDHIRMALLCGDVNRCCSLIITHALDRSIRSREKEKETTKEEREKQRILDVEL